MASFLTVGSSHLLGYESMNDVLATGDPVCMDPSLTVAQQAVQSLYPTIGAAATWCR